MTNMPDERDFIHLPPHRFRIALFQPQIAPNTGNIARLCVATGTQLHLVRPMGFTLSDRQLKRSAMDYWPRLKLTIHDDTEAFMGHLGTDRAWAFSSRGHKPLWDADFADGDWLLFGNETRGLPEALHVRLADRLVRIPQATGERCLNLATSAGIALYFALARIIA